MISNYSRIAAKLSRIPAHHRYTKLPRERSQIRGLRNEGFFGLAERVTALLQNDLPQSTGQITWKFVVLEDGATRGMGD